MHPNDFMIAVIIALIQFMATGKLGPGGIPQHFHNLDPLDRIARRARHILIQVRTQLWGLKVTGTGRLEDETTGDNVVDNLFDLGINHRPHHAEGHHMIQVRQDGAIVGSNRAGHRIAQCPH